LNSPEEIRTVWEYLVRSDFVPQFLNAYAPDGEWASLFKKCPGYLRTELRRDLHNPQRFITIDYWQSHADYLNMKEMIAAEYELLDKQCEAYTLSENHVGIFESAENPPQI